MRNNYSTKQKELILNNVKYYKSEFIVKDLYYKLNKNVGLTTIYRFIDKLVKDGLIIKNIDNNGSIHYQYLEKCEEDNHFYLKCEKCKSVTHVDCDCIKELSNHIKENHCFNLNNKIIINGICDKCSRKDKK